MQNRATQKKKKKKKKKINGESGCRPSMEEPSARPRQEGSTLTQTVAECQEGMAEYYCASRFKTAGVQR